MKRILVAIVFSALVGFSVSAASINVLAPAANTSWQIGKVQNIGWDFSGIAADTKVLIILWQNGVKLGIIADNVNIGANGLGGYPWTVGSYKGGQATAGSGFVLKVRTADNAVSAKSGSFTLTDPITLNRRPKNVRPLPPFKAKAIVVTSPKAGDAFRPYDSVPVAWKKVGNLDANVSIMLLRNGVTAAVITASTANLSGFTWEPLAQSPDPGIYVLRVETLDKSCLGLSDEFTIKESGTVILLSPKGGEVWESGSSHPVTWQRLGNVQTLDIFLYRGNHMYKTLATGVNAKLGAKTFVFESFKEDLPGECYSIIIKNSGDSTTNPGGCFTILPSPDLKVKVSQAATFINVGDTITYTVTVENMGDSISKPCQGDLRYKGAVQKTFAIPALSPVGSTTITLEWKLAGMGTVKIAVDTDNKNTELNETNNSWEYVY